MEEKQCQECKEYIRGREDKKFCSDYCRNTFNNRINPEDKKRIRNTNNRLRKNYRILRSLNRSGKTKVSRTKLYDNGFDFNFITAVYTTKNGSTYFYIYNQGYLALDNDYFLLVRKDN